jgi:hypothetical protein
MINVDMEGLMWGASGINKIVHAVVAFIVLTDHHDWCIRLVGDWRLVYSR